MELSPDLIEALKASPWLLLLVVIFWPDKGVVALWIKRSQAIKLAELKRDKAKKAVQERAAKRLKQEPPLQLPGPKGEVDGNAD